MGNMGICYYPEQYLAQHYQEQSNLRKVSAYDNINQFITYSNMMNNQSNEAIEENKGEKNKVPINHISAANYIKNQLNNAKNCSNIREANYSKDISEVHCHNELREEVEEMGDLDPASASKENSLKAPEEETGMFCNSDCVIDDGNFGIKLKKEKLNLLDKNELDDKEIKAAASASVLEENNVAMQEKENGSNKASNKATIKDSNKDQSQQNEFNKDLLDLKEVQVHDNLLPNIEIGDNTDSNILKEATNNIANDKKLLKIASKTEKMLKEKTKARFVVDKHIKNDGKKMEYRYHNFRDNNKQSIFLILITLNSDKPRNSCED